MSHEPLPPLRCESRRCRPPDGGFKWILALVVVAASLVDVLWLIPAQRAAERRARAAQLTRPPDLRWSGCHAPATKPTPAPATKPTPAPRRATRVNGILLATPRAR